MIRATQIFVIGIPGMTERRKEITFRISRSSDPGLADPVLAKTSSNKGITSVVDVAVKRLKKTRSSRENTRPLLYGFIKG